MIAQADHFKLVPMPLGFNLQQEQEILRAAKKEINSKPNTIEIKKVPEQRRPTKDPKAYTYPDSEIGRAHV